MDNPYTLEFVEKRAKFLLERDKHHNPLAILLRKNKKGKDDIIFTPLTFDDDDGKREVQLVLREVVQTENIDKYWLIMESWISSNIHVNRPSEDKDRGEALVITEFSRDNPQGRTVFNTFSRKDKKIIWKTRDVLDSRNSDDGGLKSSWNFYVEDISNKEWQEQREKARIQDLVNRLKKSDFKREHEELKKHWKKDFGTEFPLSREEVKEIMLKMAKEGKIGFKDGIVPECMKTKKEKEAENEIQ